MATTVSLAATEQEAAQLNIASRTSGDNINGTLHSCDTSIAIGGSETTGDYITVSGAGHLLQPLQPQLAKCTYEAYVLA